MPPVGPIPSAAVPLARATATAGLAAAAAIHLLWASGSTWPESEPDRLADLVVGRPPMPGPVPSASVAAALGIAAAATAATGRPRGAPGSDLVARASAVAGGVLLTRGVVGQVAGALSIGDVSERFRRWDRRLYSPLCLALGLLTLLARRR